VPSYDYFQPAGLSCEQQQLFRYVEDADLWRWRLPHSKAFTAGGLPARMAPCAVHGLRCAAATGL
jgi:oligoribonuclease NrnB/cAMP/cGMP phosphodiesterase (DHH superfamily)